MNPGADHFIQSSQLAFAMKAFAQRPGQRLAVLPYVEFIVSHLDKVSSGKVKRLVVALPPRHLKTFLCSTTFPAWILANKPQAKIMVVSYGQELADKIAFDLRSILQSDWFCRLFKTRLEKTKLDNLVTTAGGGVRSVSLEGGVTGLGADFIIVDDAVQIKDCDNAKQLERVNALFDGEIRTRLNNPKNGAIIIVAHRLAENDLPGHVLAEGGWRLVSLPLIAPRARTYKADNGFEWHRRKGELLRPDAFTSRDIERLRRAKRPGFETLQQQNPGARDRLRVKREHIGTFSRADKPTDPPVVLSIDPGQKGGLNNSFNVVQAWAFDKGRHFLFDQLREQSPYRDFRGEVNRFIRGWRPSAILIEATANGTALLSDIKSQAGMSIVAITPVDDKVSRLRRHLKTIRKGILLVPEICSWREDFLTEVLLFPYAPADDQVDAMTQYLEWISHNPRVPKRPPPALVAGTSSRGLGLTAAPGSSPTMQIPGGVLTRRRIW